MRAIEQSVPVVTCPRCAWARGGLSLQSLPMLVEALLQQALAEHLRATHGLTPAELEPPRAAPPVNAAAATPVETEPPTERRSA